MTEMNSTTESDEALCSAEDNSWNNSHEHYSIDCSKEEYFVPETILPGPDDDSPPAIPGHPVLCDNFALNENQANMNDFLQQKTSNELPIEETSDSCSQRTICGFPHSEADFSDPIQGRMR